jgi:hypothetical protein
VRLTLRQQFLTALDVSVIALHWAAVPWETVAPGVATQIRRIADHLASKASALRRGEGPPEEEVDDPLDPQEAPTEKVTQLFGDKPPK